MKSITIVVDDINVGEADNEYILSSIQDTCQSAGLQVKSIAMSGEFFYLTREFIRADDIIEAEFTDVIIEDLNEENI